MGVKFDAILGKLKSAVGEVIPLSEKGAPGGVAELGGDGKLLSSQINQVAIGRPEKVADIAERDALTGIDTGDIALVEDATADPDIDLGGANYIYDGDTDTWFKFILPTGLVLSLNNQIGHVDINIPNQTINIAIPTPDDFYFSLSEAEAFKITGITYKLIAGTLTFSAQKSGTSFHQEDITTNSKTSITLSTAEEVAVDDSLSVQLSNVSADAEQLIITLNTIY